MNLQTFHEKVLELSGVEQVAEALLNLRIQCILKTALTLADTQDFRRFEEVLGESIKEYLENTPDEQIVRELKTAIALKQRLG